MMNFLKFFTKNKDKEKIDELQNLIRKEKIDELQNLKKKLYRKSINSEEFELNDKISTDEIEREIENMKRLLNVKDTALRIIERYKKTHKHISKEGLSKEDFYKIFENKQDADIFFDKVYEPGDNRGDNEEEKRRIEYLKNKCIEIVPSEKEFVNLGLKWKNFVKDVKDEDYLTGLKTYAEKFLSKNKIEKIIKPMFERHSKNIDSPNEVYDLLSNSFENADELKGNNIGKQMKQELANIIYNWLKS